jgi:hypothetical protein
VSLLSPLSPGLSLGCLFCRVIQNQKLLVQVLEQIEKIGTAFSEQVKMFA